MANQIEFLDPGWVWVYKGKTVWKKPDGTLSDERHGYNLLTGENLSTRQVQNIQTKRREALGIPKAPTIKRSGKIRTVYSFKEEKHKATDVTVSNTQETGIGSLFNPNTRGKVATWVFYSLQDAEAYVKSHNFPKWASHGMIEVRFTERLVITNKPGSDQKVKNGYASITPFYRISSIKNFAGQGPAKGTIQQPWDVAREAIKNYDMTGKDARVYIYMAEKAKEK